MSSTPTTVNDTFDFTQGPTSGTDGPIPNAGWTPINSTRTIQAGTGTTGINVGDSEEWISNFGTSGGFATITYLPPPSTRYDLSGLLSIIVQGLQTTGVGDITVTLTDTDSSFPLSFPIPSTAADQPFPLATYELNNIDTTNIISIEVRVTNIPDITATIRSTGITFVLICVARDTEILMADGTQKLIQDIERGDLVAGDAAGATTNKVARLLHNKLPGIANVGVVEIQPHALGKNQPHTKLKISGAHPVLYHGGRHRALRFRKFLGVKYHGKRKIKAENILPKNDDGTYSLFNIQFEHDGYFVANGLTIDSVPVLCPRLPLPKELFFDQELYNKPSTVVVPPLDKGVLRPIQ